jgi:Heterokaryon incompatibility protein (HET)
VISLLRREWIKADQPNSHFVAVSYVWKAWGPPPEGPCAPGDYRIELLNGKRAIPSVVQDVVYDRLIAYAKHYDIKHIWIDQECINQSDDEEKQTAVQSMDLVYRNSYKPVALMSVQIDSQVKLDLLTSLMREEFIDGGDYDGPPKLDRSMRPKFAMKILNLLEHITSDQWWKRAWPFQEECCSFLKMCLLIRHRSGLDKVRAKEVCGDISNELEIKSADFRTEATKFCLAYRQENGA